MRGIFFWFHRVSGLIVVFLSIGSLVQCGNYEVKKLFGVCIVVAMPWVWNDWLYSGLFEGEYRSIFTKWLFDVAGAVGITTMAYIMIKLYPIC